uniref:Simila to CG2691 n=1 Tax=Papilio polytes TaxID=76194 RepID=I4DN33_PAPPL|nr:RRP12-like protein [Papilio polytes]BAM19323.1 simila to CG2691 [Papilio polytes]
MLKRLRNVRKLENRKKRAKEQKRNQTESDSDADMSVKGTSKTLEDILKDSDSEMEYLDEETRPKKAKKNKAWIQDADEIVDLADVSAARKITATDPTKKKKLIEEKAQKKKDGGFKTAADGRLIISDDVSDDEEEPKPSGDIDTDTDDTDNEADAKPSKLLKAGGKRRYDDILSVKSGRSALSKASTASKYKAGGKGIHRALGAGAGAGAGSGVTSRGAEYRGRAAGDVKKKGKPDPYAYLPLSRNNLNKRKKAITSKQFKGIVKSKTKNLKLKSKRK